MQNAAMREHMFTMRFSDEEQARAASLAKHYGINVAGVIRMLLKREEDSLAGGGPLAPLFGRVAGKAFQQIDAAGEKKPKRTRK